MRCNPDIGPYILRNFSLGLTQAAFFDTGCGFHDTVEKLVELGADMNARDIMLCTPLQNAAHGTYSALAAVPAGGTTANGVLSARGRPKHKCQTPMH